MVDPRTYLHGIGSMQTRDAAGNLVEDRPEQHYRLLSPAKLDNGVVLEFSMPSAIALALDVAITAGAEANSIRRTLERKVETERHLGSWTNIGPDRGVYDCIQHSMVCVTFSYQALETFCNDQMSLHPDVVVEVLIHRKKEKRPVSTCDRISTESKLTEVLPTVLGKPSPKGLDVWSRFKQLQKERIAVVHMRSTTSRPRNPGLGKVPKATIFHTFINSPDALWMPKTSIDLIRHFGVDEQWLTHVCQRYEEAIAPREA